MTPMIDEGLDREVVYKGPNRKKAKGKRLLALFATVAIVFSTFLIGINLNTQEAEAAWAFHTNANLDIEALTDHGRIIFEPEWVDIYPQTVVDGPTGSSFMGIVIDQSAYDHTLGAEKVADCFITGPPYASQDDFKRINPIFMIVDNGTMQRSSASFWNYMGDSGDDQDISINQTVWTIAGMDWAIFQWRLNNIKGVDLIDVSLGLEIPISQVANPDINYGLGGDSGNDIDGFDAANDTYWAQDTNDLTTMGLASAQPADPINHYYSEDFYNTYTDDEYKVLFANDTFLYNRLHQPNSVVGSTPGNRTTTVGWHNFNIPAGSFRTLTLVMAFGTGFSNMRAAIVDAQNYYQNIITGYRITEFSDNGSPTPQIEIYNHGRGPTDLTQFYFTSNTGMLSGSWSTTPVPDFAHSYFDVTGGSIYAEGDTISFYHNVDGLMDQVSFGQDGVAPDPLDGESTARRYMGGMLNEYVDEWLRNPTPNFGFENTVGYVDPAPEVVINRVMFYPTYANEGYIELMYIGGSTLQLTGYLIVCDAVYTILPGNPVSVNNRFFTLIQPSYPAGFGLDNGILNGDNIYLYDLNGNLLDMVGWNSAHNQGYFMSRSPDGGGTYKGYDDASSQTAGWAFDQVPSLDITEFSDGAMAQVEVYNPRGGTKVLDTRWELRNGVGGQITGGWNSGTILNKGYDYFTRSGGAFLGADGDTVIIYYVGGLGSVGRDAISYGTAGVAPDPLSGESTAKYWNTTIPGYEDFWNREDVPTFGTQNDVPYRNYSSFVILNEVMFNPAIAPDGRYVVIINPTTNWQINVENFMIVCDDVFTIPIVWWITPGSSLYIAYDPLVPELVALFSNMNSGGDNVYFYDPNGVLLDQVGWNTPHSTGMPVRRIPDANGTFQGFHDSSSEAAGWVFDVPLEVYMTEVSDSGPPNPQIEVYNPIYPDINFGAPGVFAFEDETGAPINGNWNPAIAGPDGYAIFQVSSALNQEGETIRLLQNGVVVDEIGYGLMGTVPDPLTGESVQRIRDPNLGVYTTAWSRQWITGKNFGAQNDVPPWNISSKVVLNEVLFNPTNPVDKYVELFLRTGTMENIGGFTIVADTVYTVPPATQLNVFTPFFYLTEPTDPTFFGQLTVTGDNIYLYDSNRSLVDMVGWDSPHTVDTSMTRLPDGNGTQDGFNDTTSEAAGWVFNMVPSYTIVTVTRNEQKWGDPGWFIWYSLNVTNLQAIPDYVDMTYVSEDGYLVEFYDSDMSTPLIDNEMPPDGIPDTGPLPPSVPYTIWAKVYIPFPPVDSTDNTTITARSSNNPLGSDTALLQSLINPWVTPDSGIVPPAPTTIYEEGAGLQGFINKTTITLNATGHGYSQFTGQDVMFVLDSSGSMEWNDPDPDGIPCNVPIPQRVQASWNYVDNMTGEDRGGYVDFDGVATLKVFLAEGTGADNYTYLKMGDPLFGGEPGLWCSDQFGATWISTAINLANQELVNNGMISHVKVMILLTDAEQIDPVDDMQSRMEADFAAANNIIIFPIGLNVGPGPPGGDDLMTYIATVTGGQYFPAPGPGALVSIFDQIFDMVRAIAGYNPTPGFPTPMISYVLEQNISYVPGSFQNVPGSVEVDPNPDWIIPFPSNTTLVWGWPTDSIRIGQFWSVQFNITCHMPGTNVPVNLVPDSSLSYVTPNRIFMVRLFPQQTINCLPPPLQPLITDITIGPGGVNIVWTTVIGAEQYEIYGGPTQTSIDLVTPITTVAAPTTTWLDTVRLGSYDEFYYLIRAVDVDTVPWTRSVTSNTVGFLRVDLPYGASGLNSISMPLEPLTPRTLDWFIANIPSAVTISWLDANDDWQTYPPTPAPFATMGTGYVLEVLADSSFVFAGEPAAMIRYTDEYGWDFSSSAQVSAALVGTDVQLTWPSLGGGIEYYVYRSTTRGGFFSGSYNILNGGLPVAGTMFTDASAAAGVAEYYYMIAPYNTGTTEIGSSTFSIGVFTVEYNGNEFFALPLIPVWYPETADWLVNQIPNALGIAYLENGIWMVHFKEFPEGVYDTIIERGRGYLVSVYMTSQYSFIGW